MSSSNHRSQTSSTQDALNELLEMEKTLSNAVIRVEEGIERLRAGIEDVKEEQRNIRESQRNIRENLSNIREDQSNIKRKLETLLEVFHDLEILSGSPEESNQAVATEMDQPADVGTTTRKRKFGKVMQDTTTALTGPSSPMLEKRPRRPPPIEAISTQGIFLF